MPQLSRREFLSLGAAALAARGDTINSPEDILEHPRQSIEIIERPRVLTAARRYLHEPPKTIVSAPASRSAGGLHDYFSEADYFWPDPKNPTGPYINRDGESDPDNFNTHRLLLIRLSIQAPALAVAWVLTEHPDFAAHAAAHLRAWFIEPATRMNPNLQYAQAVHGVSTGRSWGIIDTLHLVEVAQATIVLHNGGALAESDWEGTKNWFAQYLDWMQTSDPGRKERDAKNNHGSCWLLQAAAFASLTGDDGVVRECRDRLKSNILPTQVAPDGSFPLELVRTKPYGYSLFDLDALGMLAHVLSTKSDNLWDYTLHDGRGLAACFRFMTPFIANKQSWPYRHDVQYFDDLPVRQPSLLFAGLAYRNREYLDLWKRLDPDPQVPEVIRNHPIRQPVLWLS
ncbi:MAG: alginate lyase family protein [Terracidiphilus sp.]